MARTDELALCENESDDYISHHPFRLTDRQRFNWLRLIRCENVGPATFRDLINHFGSAEKALEALPDLSRKGGAKRAFHMASEAEVEAEWAALYRAGARLVATGEPDYPKALSPYPPPRLRCLRSWEGPSWRTKRRSPSSAHAIVLPAAQN